MKRIIHSFSRMIRAKRFRGAWVLIDRPESANDNAWHLFCYLRQSQPRVKAFYVLDDSCPRSESARQQFGNRIVSFRSPEWKELMARCSVLISSHRIATIHSHPDLEDVIKQRSTPWVFAYLNHGVARGDDLEAIAQAPIDFKTSSTPMEHHQAVFSNNPFGRSEHNTSLTGLCRWDALVSRPITSSTTPPLVLLAPTWRSAFVAQIAQTGMETEIRISEFLESAWLTHWTRLIELIREANSRHALQFGLTLLVHPQMRSVTEVWHDLGLPEVNFLLYDDIEFQSVLRSASLVVTDYSSIAFDVAVLRKPLVYFHFESHEDVSNGHTRPGYFDYETHGFGPIASNADEVVGEILTASRQSFRQEDRFAARAAEQLVFADRRARERAFHAIDAFIKNPSAKRVAERTADTNA